MHPIKLAGYHGIPLLEEEIRELYAQALHVEYRKKKEIKDKILQEIEERGTCFSTACTMVGLPTHAPMREILREDTLFQWKIEKALLKHRKHKCQIILNYLRTGGGFDGACKAAGITVNTGWAYRAADYDFDMECQRLNTRGY